MKTRREGACLVGGIAVSDGGFAGALVGRREAGELRYLGTVEFGYSERLIGEFLSRASDIARSTSPFADLGARRDAIRLEPRLVAQVTYAEIVYGRLRTALWRAPD